MSIYTSSRRRGTPLALALIAQIVGGAALGLGLGYAGMTIGQTYFAGEAAGFGDIIAAIGGILIGYPLGAGLGVGLAGRLVGRPGRPWLALLGAYLGSGAALLIIGQLAPSALVVGWGLLLLAGLGLALACYHLPRRQTS